MEATSRLRRRSLSEVSQSHVASTANDLFERCPQCEGAGSFGRGKCLRCLGSRFIKSHLTIRQFEISCNRAERAEDEAERLRVALSIVRELATEEILSARVPDDSGLRQIEAETRFALHPGCLLSEERDA